MKWVIIISRFVNNKNSLCVTQKLNLKDTLVFIQSVSLDIVLTPIECHA